MGSGSQVPLAFSVPWSDLGNLSPWKSVTPLSSRTRDVWSLIQNGRTIHDSVDCCSFVPTQYCFLGSKAKEFSLSWLSTVWPKNNTSATLGDIPRNIGTVFLVSNDDFFPSCFPWSPEYQKKWLPLELVCQKTEPCSNFLSRRKIHFLIIFPSCSP